MYVYLALRSGLRRFTPDFTDPALLGCLTKETADFRVRGHYPLRLAFPERFH